MIRALIITASIGWVMCFCVAGMPQQIVQDRCENNKRQIAEYRTELKELSIMPNAAAVGLARNKLSELNKAIAVRRSLTAYRDAENRKADEALYGLPADSWNTVPFAFTVQMRDRLNALISKASKRNHSQTASRVGFLETQISIHQDRLNDLKCGEEGEEGYSSTGSSSSSGNTLTDAQRRERCSNNRDQIAEYTAEIKEIDFAPTAAALEARRDQLSRLNKLIADGGIPTEYRDASGRETAAAEYGLRVEAATMQPQFFTYMMRARIQTLIDTAAKRDFSQSESRLTFLRTQRNIHTARMKELKCSEPASDKPEVIGLCSVRGKWSQSTSSVGSSVWNVEENGTATEDGLGRATGTASLSGTTMRITWTTSNGWAGVYEWVMDQKCAAGRGKLTFSAGGRAGDSPSSTVSHSQ
jgi:hypothetical protein